MNQLEAQLIKPQPTVYQIVAEVTDVVEATEALLEGVELQQQEQGIQQEEQANVPMPAFIITGLHEDIQTLVVDNRELQLVYGVQYPMMEGLKHYPLMEPSLDREVLQGGSQSGSRDSFPASSTGSEIP